MKQTDICFFGCSKRKKMPDCLGKCVPPVSRKREVRTWEVIALGILLTVIAMLLLI